MTGRLPNRPPTCPTRRRRRPTDPDRHNRDPDPSAARFGDPLGLRRPPLRARPAGAVVGRHRGRPGRDPGCRRWFQRRRRVPRGGSRHAAVRRPRTASAVDPGAPVDVRTREGRPRRAAAARAGSDAAGARLAEVDVHLCPGRRFADPRDPRVGTSATRATARRAVPMSFRLTPTGRGDASCSTPTEEMAGPADPRSRPGGGGGSHVLASVGGGGRLRVSSSLDGASDAELVVRNLGPADLPPLEVGPGLAQPALTPGDNRQARRGPAGGRFSNATRWFTNTASNRKKPQVRGHKPCLSPSGCRGRPSLSPAEGSTPFAPFAGRHQAPQSMSGNRKIGAVSPLGWAALLGSSRRVVPAGAGCGPGLGRRGGTGGHRHRDHRRRRAPRPPWRPAPSDTAPRPARRPDHVGVAPGPAGRRRHQRSRGAPHRARRHAHRRSDAKKAADAAGRGWSPRAPPPSAGPSEPVDGRHFELQRHPGRSRSRGSRQPCSSRPPPAPPPPARPPGGLTSAGSLNSRRNAAGSTLPTLRRSRLDAGTTNERQRRHVHSQRTLPHGFEQQRHRPSPDRDREELRRRRSFTGSSGPKLVEHRGGHRRQRSLLGNRWLSRRRKEHRHRDSWRRRLLGGRWLRWRQRGQPLRCTRQGPSRQRDCGRR